MEGYKGAPALDAGLVAAAQAVEHYEIARYGTLVVWAEQMGMTEAAELLKPRLAKKKQPMKRSRRSAKAASTNGLCKRQPDRKRTHGSSGRLSSCPRRQASI